MESTYIKADYGVYPALRTTKTGHEALFGQILFPLGTGDGQPEIEDLSTEKLLGAQISTKHKTDIFLKSHSEKTSKKAGLEFNGDFAWISLDENDLKKAAGQSVKSFSYDETSILSSDERITFAIKWDPIIELGVAVEKPTKITLNLGRRISSVTRNGKTIPCKRDGEAIIVTLSESGNYFLK